MTTSSVTALILAGGKARRMGGVDKGLALLAGRAMIEYVLDKIRPQVESVLINANRNITQYQAYDTPIVSDTLTDFQGPLAGFLAGLQQTRTDYMVTLPCDGPKVPEQLVTRLLDALLQHEAEIAVAHDGERMQPVYALLQPSLVPSLMEFLASGDRKIDRWYAQHHTINVDFSDVPDAFDNINTHEELNRESQRHDCLDPRAANYERKA